MGHRFYTDAYFFGFTLAVVFQLAHVVEHTEFESIGLEDKVIEAEWAVHQVKGTANFSPNNKVVSWFVGGLNYQIEHHLFPRISHIHYPALSKIVEENCKKFNLPYYSFPSMGVAFASHMRIMIQLGKNEPAYHPAVPVSSYCFVDQQYNFAHRPLCHSLVRSKLY